MGFGSSEDTVSGIIQILPFALIFVVFYFFLIRPQQAKAKQLKAMLDGLRRGDRVAIGGGIIGTIAKIVNGDELLADIADGVRVRVLRSSITAVLAKTEPATAKDKADDDKDLESAGADSGSGDQDRRKGGPRRPAGN